MYLAVVAYLDVVVHESVGANLHIVTQDGLGAYRSEGMNLVHAVLF